MRKSIKTILIGIIITITATILTVSTQFYIEQKVKNALLEEQEKTQEIKIQNNSDLIVDINVELDSIVSNQDKQVLNNAEMFNNISKQLNNITYVIKKNNESMKNDLDYIKSIQSLQQRLKYVAN